MEDEKEQRLTSAEEASTEEAGEKTQDAAAKEKEQRTEPEEPLGKKMLARAFRGDSGSICSLLSQETKKGLEQMGKVAVQVVMAGWSQQIKEIENSPDEKKYLAFESLSCNICNTTCQDYR
eukprot:1557604-Rhodomonas_salina.4